MTTRSPHPDKTESVPDWFYAEANTFSAGRYKQYEHLLTLPDRPPSDAITLRILLEVWQNVLAVLLNVIFTSNII